MTDTIHTWMGQPLSEIPRDLLERLFVETYARAEAAELKALDLRTQSIRDFANFRRQLMIARQPWLARLGSRIFS